MTAHPAQLLLLLVLGAASLPVLAAAAFLIHQAYRRRGPLIVRPGREDGRPRTQELPSTYRWNPRERALLLGLAALLLLWVFFGKLLVQPFFERDASSKASPQAAAGQLTGASGANLAVVRTAATGATGTAGTTGTSGTTAASSPAGATRLPTLVLTHGWGADHQDWDYLVQSLRGQFNVVAWDLPGLGASSVAKDYELQTLAGDLDSVVSSVQGPVILVGHSIGGMLNLEYARRYPTKLGAQVQALAQVNTTYTNPVETKKGAELSRKLQKPVYEPLLHVITWTSPIARGLGWLAYRSGLAHVQMANQSFAGNETWQQLDHMASYSYRSSPGVIARGVLGMLHWDASDVLPKIRVPALIISGNEDTTTLPLASDRMEKDIPSAKRVSVAGAAHLGPVEQHQRYADEIANFAKGLAGAR